MHMVLMQHDYLWCSAEIIRIKHTYTHLNKINITRPKNYSVINIIALNVENFEGKYDYAKKTFAF